MKLELRETKECFKEPLQYSEHNEEWTIGNNSFSYYRFHAPRQDFNLELVSMYICPEGPFDCSGPPLWVCNINPVALVKFEENIPLRKYGAGDMQNAINLYLAYFSHSKEDDHRAFFSKLYNKVYPNNERSTPQTTLERLVRINKPNQWPWDKTIDLIYENITTARNALIDYARQLPNENFAKVIGDLNLTKPSPSSFRSLD